MAVYTIRKNKDGTFQAVIVHDEIHFKVLTIISEFPTIHYEYAQQDLWECIQNPPPWETRATVRYGYYDNQDY